MALMLLGNIPRKIQIFLLIFLLSAAEVVAATTAEASKQLVTYAVVQVGKTVVTSREVRITMIVDASLVEGALPSGFSQADLHFSKGDQDFDKTVNQIILDQVLSLEADSFGVAIVDNEVVQRDSRILSNELRKNSEWLKLDVQINELEVILARKRRAQMFLKTKADSFSVRVSDDDIRDYYEKNRVKFGNLPIDSFKSGIRETLVRTQALQKMKDWFGLLKKKHQVKWLKKIEAS